MRHLLAFDYRHDFRQAALKGVLNLFDFKYGIVAAVFERQPNVFGYMLLGTLVELLVFLQLLERSSTIWKLAIWRMREGVRMEARNSVEKSVR